MKRAQIEKSLTELANYLESKNIRGEIGIFGGAAMVLAYNARAATKDVDAIFKPSKDIRQAALHVANQLGLPKDWLNDVVKGFLPKTPAETQIVFESESLVVWTPPAEYLLAMKAISARLDSKDAEDIKLLCQHLKIKAVEKVLDIVCEYYPKRQVPARTVFFLEEIFEAGTEN